MALVAPRTKLTLVYVVTLVTAAAASRHVGAAAGRIAVAVVALQSQVRTVDRKVGMQIVIESRQRPVVAVMAGAAIVAKATFVRISLAVAIDAPGRRVVEAIARVAGAACDRGMQTGQREG